MTTEKTKRRKDVKTRDCCDHCGFRIRGKNHNEGQHHNAGRGGKAAINK